MASSPYTARAVEYVSRNEGCCKFALARHLTNHPRRNPSKQYYLVNTQIRLGNLVAEQGKDGVYRLCTREYYRQLLKVRHDAELDGVTV